MNSRKSTTIPPHVFAFMAARSFAMSAFMPVVAATYKLNELDVATKCALTAVGIMGMSLSDAVSSNNKVELSDYCPAFTTNDQLKSAVPSACVSLLTSLGVIAAMNSEKYSLPTIVGVAATVLALNTGIRMYRDLARMAVLETKDGEAHREPTKEEKNM